MIKLQNVSKIYSNKVRALDNINIEIKDGEFFAITGISGSGKSTLLNLIGALDMPTEGKIYCDKIEISALKDSEMGKFRLNNTGFIFQSFYLEPTFSVLKNVTMPLILKGIDKKIREKKATEILDYLGMHDKINAKVSELSGGQMQRVAIARALVNDPKYILADEPTGNLDSKNGREVINILRDLADKGKTILLITHNMEDAKTSDRQIILEDGKIIETINHKENILNAQKIISE